VILLTGRNNEPEKSVYSNVTMGPAAGPSTTDFGFILLLIPPGDSPMVKYNNESK